VAYNPFYDTIRQNTELSHGITERIPLKLNRTAKDRIEDLPFSWLRDLGRWAAEDDGGTDAEDHYGGDSGSGSGSGISGGDHSGMSSDSDEDSGSGHEHAYHVRMDQPAVASTVSPLNNTETTLEDPQAEGSEALAMQFYRIELGEQRRLMGVMEHHSRESGRVIEGGERKGSKSKSKRSKQRSKGTGRSSRGKHGSRDFPYSITAGVEKGAKNRQVQHFDKSPQSSDAWPSHFTGIVTFGPSSTHVCASRSRSLSCGRMANYQLLLQTLGRFIP
jgi:hypothetical protein